MQITISEKALEHLNKNNKNSCLVSIRKGGCFGFMYDLTITDTLPEYDSQAYSHTEQKDQSININTIKPKNLELPEDLTLTIEYTSSLLKAGYTIQSNLRTCCCNKSFGMQLQKQNCLTESA